MTVNLDKGMPVAVAIEKLFGIKLSKHEGLKNKLNSLLRNGLIVYQEQRVVDRKSRLISRDQLTTLHNAVLVQSLISDPKKVKRVFDDQTYRADMAGLFSALLLDRRSIVDISLLKPEVVRFLGTLSSGVSLRDVMLANPFETLPQVVLDESVELLQVILAQANSLSNGDAMMAHYLNGELQLAWDAAQALDSTNERLQQYQRLIEREYREAQDFDELLDFLK